MSRTALLVGLLSVPLGFIATTYGPDIANGLETFGVFRTPIAGTYESIVNIDGPGVCEDLHYYEAANTIFTACEQVIESRYHWFPPLAVFGTEGLDKTKGALWAIDAKTQEARQINIVKYSGPFITHGIDVIPDLAFDKPDQTAVYIVAINHLPNPAYLEAVKNGASTEGIEKARSQLELFHYIIGSSIAQHVRSIYDPLVTTPNDVLALSPNEFLVTNDHHYREGGMRSLEDIWARAEWTNTIHLRVQHGRDTPVRASVATTKNLHNNNGIAHGPGKLEIAIASAASGQVHFGKVVQAANGGRNVTITEKIRLPAIVDNPSYFADPFAKATGDEDLGAWVLPGLSRAITLGKTTGDPEGLDPSMVWLARKNKTTGEWTKKLIFEDDGSRIRSASGAVLVAIDPREEGGKRKAWLYVSGFISSNVIAVKIDL